MNFTSVARRCHYGGTIVAPIATIGCLGCVDVVWLDHITQARPRRQFATTPAEGYGHTQQIADPRAHLFVRINSYAVGHAGRFVTLGCTRAGRPREYSPVSTFHRAIVCLSLRRTNTDVTRSQDNHFMIFSTREQRQPDASVVRIMQTPRDSATISAFTTAEKYSKALCVADSRVCPTPQQPISFPPLTSSKRNMSDSAS
ncbi:hypothetical protein LSAT2_022267, partial [Lamellibrachia satsuma]